MCRHPLIRLLVLTLAALLLGLPYSTAAAAGRVTVEKVEVDDTFVPPIFEQACGFPVEIHVEGELRIITRTDAAGNVVSVITTYPQFKITHTNVETGEAIITPSPAMDKTTYNADGSFTVAINGLLGHLVVPGEGQTAADVGRIVLYFSGPDDEQPDIMFQAGQSNNGPLPQLCELLG
jgi:hypothetical protein